MTLCDNRHRCEARNAKRQPERRTRGMSASSYARLLEAHLRRATGQDDLEVGLGPIGLWHLLPLGVVPDRKPARSLPGRIPSEFSVLPGAWMNDLRSCAQHLRMASWQSLQRNPVENEGRKGVHREMSAENGSLFLGPTDGKVLLNPIGGRMMVKVRDEDTTGAYSVHENTIPPGSPGPRPHIHRNHEEAFYVLEGELTVRAGARTITAPAGSWWFRVGSSTNPRTPDQSRPGCCSSSPQRGWVASSRKRPNGACHCRPCRPTRLFSKSLRSSQRSTATSSQSFHQSRREYFGTTQAVS